MKLLKYIIGPIWRLWFFIIFIITFLLFIPWLFYYTTVNKNQKKICFIAHLCSKITLSLSFVFPRIEYEDEIDQDKTYILCPNHTSALDIPFIYAIFPMPIQFIGKAELSKIPLFGYFFKHNSVVVNRKNKTDSYEAFLNTKIKLKNKINMCIFPEGGIPKKNILLKKFKNGAFKLAIEEDISIIPITIADNKKIFPSSYFKGYPGLARVKIHKAINLKEKNIEKLNFSVYNIIFEQLKLYGNK